MVPSPVKASLTAALLCALVAEARAQLGPDRNVLYDQATAFSSISSHESDDRLGSALAAGDFNGDGWDDLAVGSPYEDIGTLTNAGAVFVIFGGEDGLQQRAGSLTGNAAEAFNQADLVAAGDLVTEGSEEQDYFGEVLAAGDLDADGFDDLVVGAPSESLLPVDAAPEGATHQHIGIVVVAYGSSQGLRGPSGELRFQVLDGDRLRDLEPQFERFGAALAVGDFDGNGVDDLAVGEPGADNGGATGAVRVYRGTQNVGLSEAQRLNVYEAIEPGFGGPEVGDKFGAAVAAGDFDADGFDDLAIGSSGEEVPDLGLGAVMFAYGSETGLGPALTGLPLDGGEVESRLSIAAGDYSELDGRDDVAIGIAAIGRLKGSTATPEGFEGLSSGYGGVEAGFAVTAGSLNRTEGEDFAAGDPGDGAEEVFVVTRVDKGEPNRLFYDQDRTGYVDQIEAGDRFGHAVAIGEFGLGEGKDLAVGVPGEDSSGATDNGAFHVIYNILLFDDGFESTNLAEWSDSAP